MSLKPKKKSDIKKIEEKMKNKESKMATKELLPKYTMIVSEGIKTEPIYLRGFVNKINEKYKNIVRDNRIVVYGTGRNTNGLIKFVDKMRESGEWERYKKFWLVYDKDDFPLDNFDNTQFEAEARKDVEMSVAWSNESIELWFLLHFQDYIHRAFCKYPSGKYRRPAKRMFFQNLCNKYLFCSKKYLFLLFLSLLVIPPFQVRCRSVLIPF